MPGIGYRVTFKKTLRNTKSTLYCAGSRFKITTKGIKAYWRAEWAEYLNGEMSTNTTVSTKRAVDVGEARVNTTSIVFQL